METKEDFNFESLIRSAEMAQSSARDPLSLCIRVMDVFQGLVNGLVKTLAIYNILGVDIEGKNRFSVCI